MKEPFLAISASSLVAEMEKAVAGDPGSGVDGCMGLVMELVASNCRQWDLEDAARDPGASDAAVADAKRAIDRLNLSRHRLVQQIDAAIDSALDQSPVAPVATESPGMVIDRITVLVIRRVRTAAMSPGEPEYAGRVPVLDSQLAALSAALDTYMEELRSGRRRFVPYEHLKLYGASARGED
jgi:Protein of unknown function (DUF4254)